ASLAASNAASNVVDVAETCMFIPNPPRGQLACAKTACLKTSDTAHQHLPNACAPEKTKPKLFM
ncbi:MAG: hypothetical protein VX201_22255, partial [Pseudomonadota bacterium]|nr:hypothetical protein [Pseudomonadota bacterium]